MRRILPVFAVCALAGAITAAGASAATTSVVPGWPVRVGAGTVLPGPGGGVVVVAAGAETLDGTPATVSAFRRDGRRLWSTGRVPGCGNCDDGPQPEALQPDGTYGPIGVEGDDFWAIDARGREVTGCAGAVAADGTCYFVRSDISTSVPTVVARDAGGTVAWSVDEPGYRWIPEFDVPPIVARDRAGVIYTALGFGTDAAGTAQDGRLIAVDPATRAILWGRPGPDEVLTGLGAGVLVARGGSIVSFGPTGTERWSRALASGQSVRPAEAVYDRPRNRIYVGLSGRAPGVTALVASTGARVWSTRAADRARLLSVGRSGRVYLAIDAPARRGVRAVRISDGRTVWQRRTGQPVRGALELRNGLVAVSAGAQYARTAADRLTVLRPRSG